MVAFRADFVAGAKAISPILPAGATVGIVTGLAATEAGLPPLRAITVSIAPHLDRLATRWKWFLAYLPLTPVYALSIEQFDGDPTTSRRGHWLGVAISLRATVQMAPIAGIVSGASVPAAWPTGSVLATIGVGMGVLRGAHLLFG